MIQCGLEFHCAYLQIIFHHLQFAVVGCDVMQEEVGIETDEEAGVVIPDL